MTSLTQTTDMSFSFPPTFHAVSKPLYDEQMQLDEHLDDERKEFEADLARYDEYYADNESEIPNTQASTIAVADTVSSITDKMRLLGVPEEDEDSPDYHSCDEADCPGEYAHTFTWNHDYESGHISPSTQAYNELMPYCPSTPTYAAYGYL